MLETRTNTTVRHMTYFEADFKGNNIVIAESYI